MSKDKLANALDNLGLEVMDSWRSGWNTYLKLVTDVARNPSSIQQSQREYLNYISHTAPGHFLRVVEAGTLCYTAVAEAGSEIANQFLNRVDTSIDAEKSENGAAGSARPGAPVSGDESFTAASIDRFCGLGVSLPSGGGRIRACSDYAGIVFA